MQIKNSKINGSVYSLFGYTLFSLIFLSMPNAFSKGAYEGLLLVANVVIPALFPFTVATVFLIKSGGLKSLGGLINKATVKILGLSGAEFTALILSFLGGYPLGAKILSEMYTSGLTTEKRGKRLLLFAVNPSPAFYISFIGSALLKSTEIGVILFLSNLFASFILTLISFKIKAPPYKDKSTSVINEKPISDAFVESVFEGTSVIINISALVTLFSSALAITDCLPISKDLKAVISCFFEITLGSEKIIASSLSVYLLSFFLTFGGLSTICQVKQAADELKPKFIAIFLGRIIHGATSLLFTVTAFKIFKPSLQVINNGIKIIKPEFTLSLSYILLITFGVFFILFIRKNNSNVKNN